MVNKLNSTNWLKYLSQFQKAAMIESTEWRMKLMNEMV